MSLSDSLQYAAGFLDADGCISKDRYNGLVIRFYNTDIRPLERIRTSLDIDGRMDGRFRQNNTKESFTLVIARQEESIPLGRLLSPYIKLKEKRLEDWFLYEREEVVHGYEPINDHYVAGFFDGDGCINLHKSQNTRYNKTYTYWQIIFTNTDLPTLEMIKDYLDAGNIYTRTPNKSGYGNKVCFSFMTTKKTDVIKIAKRLSPLCSTDKVIGLRKASCLTAKQLTRNW